MRRLVFAAAIAGVCLMGWRLAVHKATAAAPPEKEGVQIRRADFSFRNSDAIKNGQPHVVGQGGFPVRLDITDTGFTSKIRRLQVMIALYAKPDPNTVKPGPLVQVLSDPRILTTTPDKNEHEFNLDIPLLPGDFMAYVILCDPDVPFHAGRLAENATLPAPDQFPGLVRRLKSVSIHVDPGA